MIGALVAAPIADRIGRKFSISFWALINMVGIIVQIATVDKWYQIALGRWVMGLGVGALSSVVPMYQSESAPRQVRGAMVSAFQLFVAFGIFISYIINFGTERLNSTASWRITMGIGFAWPLILGVGTLFLPSRLVMLTVTAALRRLARSCPSSTVSPPTTALLPRRCLI